MMHTKHLCHLPQVKKGDASSIRQLTNHVSSHMKALQAVFKCNFSRFDVEPFDVRNFGFRDTTRMGAQHSFTYRHSFNYRTNDVPGIKMQGLGIASAYSDTEYICFHTTVITPSGN